MNLLVLSVGLGLCVLLLDWLRMAPSAKHRRDISHLMHRKGATVIWDKGVARPYHSTCKTCNVICEKYFSLTAIVKNRSMIRHIGICQMCMDGFMTQRRMTRKNK